MRPRALSRISAHFCGKIREIYVRLIRRGRAVIKGRENVALARRDARELFNAFVASSALDVCAGYPSEKIDHQSADIFMRRTRVSRSRRSNVNQTISMQILFVQLRIRISVFNKDDLSMLLETITRRHPTPKGWHRITPTTDIPKDLPDDFEERIKSLLTRNIQEIRKELAPLREE